MRLQITVDVFSGRPNPSWTIEDREEINTLLERFNEQPGAFLGDEQSIPGKLGLRAVRAEFVSDDAPENQPSSFILAASGASDAAASSFLAELLVGTRPAGAAGVEAYPQEFWDHIVDEIRRWPDTAGGADPRLSAPTPRAPGQGKAGQAQIVCPYDTAPYNPAWWNTPQVQPYNNCYNYATNWATGTFAQPGRAHGYAIPPSCTCAEVAHGAQLDGYRPDGNCQPAGTYNRWLVALVTGTFPSGVRDYHWYRLQSEGFWGHKPGGTPVINTDNAGQVIWDPQTCNRGYYTNWCGYFLCSNLVVIN